MNVFIAIANNGQVTGTISAVILLTLTGYLLTITNVFTAAFEQQITKLILTLAVPALSFTSFMQPLNHQLLRDGNSMGIHPLHQSTSRHATILFLP